jgi:hypothetical protein
MAKFEPTRESRLEVAPGREHSQRSPGSLKDHIVGSCRGQKEKCEHRG